MRRMALVCWLWLLWLPRAGAIEPGQSAGEFEIKAAMVYNFLRFVDWPAAALNEPEGDLRVCVAGRDALEPALEAALRGKKLGRRPLRLERPRTAEAARTCHLLYVGRAEKRRVADWLSALAGLPVLTVSDLEGFVSDGGMIGLVESGDNIRFEIGTPPAARSQLRISAKLLGLAVSVSGGPERRGN